MSATSNATLITAINCVDAGSTSTIDISNSFSLGTGASNELPAITSAVTINGGGFTITGTGAVSGGSGIFFIAAGSGNAVNINSLDINNGYAKGGTGNAGGGGLGAGGAIFAMSGAITLTNVGLSEEAGANACA